MKPNKILSVFLSIVLIFSTVSFCVRADFDEAAATAVIHNIAAKCAEGDITEDGNFIWFLADMEAYRSLYPESESVLSAEKTEKCKEKLLDFAKKAETGVDYAKAIIGFRALGYDPLNIYISDTEKIELVAPLAALVNAKSNTVTNIYYLPYVAMAMRKYATDEQNAYLLKAMLKQKAKWQDTALGTDAATPMILALSPYYAENEEVKTVVDETVTIIKASQNENGLISNAPSTGLAIAAMSAIGAAAEDIESLISGLMGEATPEADGFLPIINSFGTEQGFRGLIAYKLRDSGKSMFDFSDYPKNELKEKKQDGEETVFGGNTGGIKTEEKEKVSVAIKVMAHSSSECNNSYTYKNNAAKYTALLSKTVEIEKDKTVLDATLAALSESGISYTERGGYVSKIGSLSEFDHGEFSGWMYMVNGEHQTVGSNYVTVKPDSTVLWFYTDDYRYEKGSESFGYTVKEEKIEKNSKDSSKTADAISDTVSFVLNTVKNPQISSIGGEWAVLGLSGSGVGLPDGYIEEYYKNVENTVKENEGILSSRKYTEYSRVIIALTRIGKNPQDVAGYDLTEPLCDFEKTVAQGLNGAIWALIALDSGNYGNSEIRGKYLDTILSREISSGGWALSQNETAPDCDVTAMALTALANHKEENGVAEAITRGLSVLSEIQNDDGGFSTYGEETAESAAQVVLALAALGIDENDNRFVKNGKTVTENLLSYYIDGKGFSHTKGGEPNQMATEQALFALSSQKRFNEGKRSLLGKSRFYDIVDNKNQEAIEKMAENGIISGMSDNVFAPEKSVTRAQFATMIVRALHLPQSDKSQFSDVNEKDWFYPYISAAYKNGIIYGVSEHEFNPNGRITCEEAAAMLERASALCGIDKNENGEEITLSSEVSDWARESLIFCIDLGILDDDEISAKEILMRSQIAQMIYNMLKKAAYL